MYFPLICRSKIQRKLSLKLGKQQGKNYELDKKR